MMSRFKRRTLAAIVGLSLGWVAAGLSFPSAHAEEEAPKAAAVVEKPAASDVGKEEAAAIAVAETQAGTGGPAKVPAKSNSMDDNQEDDGIRAAQKLAPHFNHQIGWFRPVLGIIFGLFVAAVIFGWPAAIAKGPPLPEPADDDHSHDAGKKDAHGHAADSHGHH